MLYLFSLLFLFLNYNTLEDRNSLQYLSIPHKQAQCLQMVGITELKLIVLSPATDLLFHKVKLLPDPPCGFFKAKTCISYSLANITMFV